MNRTTGRASLVNGILMYMFVLTATASASKIIRTSAKSLAEKAGAAQYAVHIEEELTSDEIGGERKQRASFDDSSDYEIYQGVVGRPGIDFPIQASIPQTAFSCATFGNGYFADLDTKCQVFHICEGGKKISFLCPNGTIFQQTDLICDWWFRVNCANSPDYYAESAEILTRSQNHNFKTIIEMVNAAGDGDGSDGNNSSSSNHHHNDARVHPKLHNGHTFTLRSNKHLTHASTAADPQPRSAERFDVADMYAAPRHKERGTHHTRTSATAAAAARKLAPSAPTFNPADLLETQEVAETASFARSNHHHHGSGGGGGGHAGRNSFLTQPIYVRSVQVENETTITHNSQHQNGTENIRTNYNIINYLQSSSSSSSSIRSGNGTKQRPTAAAQSIEPIYRRGTILYSGGQATKTLTQKEAQLPSYTTPNQIQFTDPNPKSAKTPRRPQKMRSTQYYTPTVPTILARATTRALGQSADERNAPLLSPTTTTTTAPTPSDHAIEMMRILNELMVGNRQLKDNGRTRTDGSPEGRSLALYFATGEDNSVVNDVPFATVKLDLDTPNDLDAVAVSNVTHISSSLLSNSTIYKYDKLFAAKTDYNAQSSSAAASVDTGVHADPQAQDTAPLDFDAASNDVLTADTTPAIRSLAQVFTHALSAYLHDPTTFRQVLSEIRPTEPPALDAPKRSPPNSRRTERFFPNGPQATTNSFVTNPDELEVLDFSDVTVSTQQNEANFPSTTPQTPTGRSSDSDLGSTDTPAVKVPKYSVRPSVHFVATADHVPASRLLTDNLEKNAQTTRKEQLAARRNPLALEINGAFIASTSFPYFQDDSLEQMRRDANGDVVTASTQRYPTTYAAATTTTTTNSANNPTTTDWPAGLESDTAGSLLENEFNLPLPNLEPLNLDDNDLQRSASASFVAAGGHQLLHNRLDAPIGLLRSSTAAPPPLAPLGQQQRSGDQRRTTLAYTVFLDPLTINDELLHSSSAVTPSLHTYLPKSTTAYGDTSAGTTEPSTATASPFTESRRRGKFQHGDATPSPVSGQVDTATTAADVQYMDLMQERANEMFGGLNNTSAAHLMNVMRKANKNKTVRKLILLLIQTCDEDYSTTVEQSRSALLNALIGMDSGKFNDSIDVKVISPFKYRRGKSAAAIGDEQQQQQQQPTADVRTTVAAATTASVVSTVPAIDTTTAAYEEPTANERWFDRTTTTVQDPFDYATESSALFATGFEDFASDRPWTTTDQPPSYDDQQLGTTSIPNGWDSSDEARGANASPTTTAPPTTTTMATTTTTTTTARSAAIVSRGATRHHARRIVKDLDELLVAESSQSYDPSRFRSLAAASADSADKRSDTRALDLLRSLYTLAGKLGK